MVEAIRIKEGSDPSALRQEYARTGRMHVTDFLETEDADGLQSAFRSNQHWYLTYTENGQAVECPNAEVQRLAPQQRQQFFTAIHRRAADEFQFCFLQYYITEALRRNDNPGHLLHGVHGFVNSESFLGFMRALTGVAAIRSADVLASCYGPGHYLTAHDDTHHSRDRVAAYVIGLTRNWNPNWGGHLAFFDEKGNIDEAQLPSFNTLSVFAVPQCHAVQMVAPFARGLRTSLTGWVHV